MLSAVVTLPFAVGEGMRFIRRGGISAGGTLRCYLVLGVGNALTGDGQTVIRVFRRGVSAGTGHGSFVLGRVCRSPGAVGQRVICVLIVTVSAIGASFQPPVLISVVAFPASVTETVARVTGRADIGITNRTIAYDLVLCAAVLLIGGCRGMALVFIVRSAVTVGTGIGTTVIGAVVVIPIAIGVRPVLSAAFKESAAACAVPFIITARYPNRSVRRMGTSRSVGAISQITAFGTAVIAAVVVGKAVIFAEDTAALVFPAVGTPVTNTMDIIRPLFVVQRVGTGRFTGGTVPGRGCRQHRRGFCHRCSRKELNRSLNTDVNRRTVCRPVIIAEIVHRTRVQNGELEARVVVDLPFQRMIGDKGSRNELRGFFTAEHHIMECMAVMESVIADLADIIR